MGRITSNRDRLYIFSKGSTKLPIGLPEIRKIRSKDK